MMLLQPQPPRLLGGPGLYCFRAPVLCTDWGSLADLWRLCAEHQRLRSDRLPWKFADSAADITVYPQAVFFWNEWRLRCLWRVGGGEDSEAISTTTEELVWW
jgi:hypothetical protein